MRLIPTLEILGIVLHQCSAFQVPYSNLITTQRSQHNNNNDLNIIRCCPPIESTTTRLMDRANNGDTDDDDDDDARERRDSKYRIVASSDGKIDSIPESTCDPDLLERIDIIYNAIAHTQSRRLKDSLSYDDYDDTYVFEEHKEEKLVSVLRTSLEDAGFELLTKRDLDLCEALNAGYLLRLSIIPNTADLDPRIGQEFYPELYSKNGTTTTAPTDDDRSLLYDGRILIFRRGYSSEISRGKLLGAKLDYVQASLVQKSASRVTEILGRFERRLLRRLTKSIRSASANTKEYLAGLVDVLPSFLGDFLKNQWGWKKQRIGSSSTGNLQKLEEKMQQQENIFFKLGRYGGSRVQFVGSPDSSDALTPFLVCKVTDGPEDNEIIATERSTTSLGISEDIDRDIIAGLNNGDYTCQYDEESANSIPATLLERITLSNVVDLYSPEGRKRVAKSFMAESELVEPTYEKVIAIWRPLPKKPKRKRVIAPPKQIYEIAELFDIEEKLPKKPDPIVEPDPCKMEIRTFDDVPMANIPAVFPKTRLKLRPADAFLFDLTSVFTLLVVLGSQRYDNPKLDLIALVSVVFWLFRTFVRYSNKLARYDLLVKNFLSSKISHRGSGAVRYIVDEGGSQRALRVALLHAWVLDEFERDQKALSRERILSGGFQGMNHMLLLGETPSSSSQQRLVDLNVEAALDDLEGLGLVSFNDGEEETVSSVASKDRAMMKLKETWDNVFDGGDLATTDLARRRRRTRN